jgi:hypothetical protein
LNSNPVEFLMKITPTSLTITQLLSSGTEQYVVPAYQRRYSWHEKQIDDLLEDVDLLQGADTHLLGSIVCLTAEHTAGINRLELVDGQQRLTTVSILLHCIHERLLELKDTTAFQEVSPLLTARPHGAPPVRKIALDSLDSSLFDRLSRGDGDDGKNPALNEAFQRFRQWAAERDASKLTEFLYKLKDQVKVIRLDVSEAKDAFKLFETINNRGLRLSATDIIKNFLLGNAARFGQTALERARANWADLIAALDGVNTETFFRQFLSARLRRRVTKSFVVITFKRVFMNEVAEALDLPERQRYIIDGDAPEPDEGDDSGNDPADDPDHAGPDAPLPVPPAQRIAFADFLEDLVTRGKLYAQVVRAATGKEAVDRRLRNLRMIKAVQTYGFLAHLRASGCSDNDFERVLQLTEGFLIRRHVCRMRANETEAAYAKLCGVDAANPLPEVTQTYREYSPSDERFREDFAAVKFGAGLMDRARYCLAQVELKQQGAYTELLVGGPDVVHVEHVIPQKIKTKKAKKRFGDWPTYLGGQATSGHARYVSRIGNLTLVAGPLNIGASNNPYERKKVAYRQSALKITKSLPDEFPEFRFAQLDDRSARLADVAVKLWPIP